MNNKIVFNENGIVVKITDGKNEVIKVDKYLNYFDSNLNSKNRDYYVFFNSNKNIFYITDNSKDYEVILNDDDQKTLENKEYSILVKNLLYLAAKSKKIATERNKKEVIATKINAMEQSNYEDIEEVEDLELYRNYLINNKLKLAKTKEDILTIQTKIIGISLLIKRLTREEDSKIETSLDLTSYLNSFIDYVKSGLRAVDSRSNKLKILNFTKGIINDYKKCMDLKHKNDLIVRINKYLPVKLLNKIDTVELFLDRAISLSNGAEKELNDIKSDIEAHINVKNGAK